MGMLDGLVKVVSVDGVTVWTRPALAADLASMTWVPSPPTPDDAKWHRSYWRGLGKPVDDDPS